MKKSSPKKKNTKQKNSFLNNKKFRYLILLLFILFLIILFDRAIYSPASQETEKKETAKVKETPTVTLTPEITEKPTQTPTIYVSPTPADTIENGSWVYPNSYKTSGGENNFELESYDDPITVTDWYERKIREMNFSVDSFVKTSVNDNVVNKLIGSSGRDRVFVEITKKNSDAVSKITVRVR